MKNKRISLNVQNPKALIKFCVGCYSSQRCCVVLHPIPSKPNEVLLHVGNTVRQNRAEKEIGVCVFAVEQPTRQLQGKPRVLEIRWKMQLCDEFSDAPGRIQSYSPTSLEILLKMLQLRVMMWSKLQCRIVFMQNTMYVLHICISANLELESIR